jgi:hypothetical protein
MKRSCRALIKNKGRMSKRAEVQCSAVQGRTGQGSVFDCSIVQGAVEHRVLVCHL